MEDRPPEEKENGEIGGRGRKRLGDLGLPRGEGQEHKKEEKIFIFRKGSISETCYNIGTISEILCICQAFRPKNCFPKC